MVKSKNFTGQPIFSQIINFLPKSDILTITKRFKADRYCKRFNSYEHLITLMYCVLNGCTTLREVTTGLLACEQKLIHLGMRYHPRRSTLSDANSRRPAELFEEIYSTLYRRYRQLLPDSRLKKKNNLYIFDSTSITLFQEVLRASGLTPSSGKQKGGIKAHTLIRSDMDVPCFVRFSSAVTNDTKYLKEIQLPAGSILLFDRGYNDYVTFQRFTDEKITWVTRKRASAVYTKLNSRIVSQEHMEKGVKEDIEIMLGHSFQKSHQRVRCRLIIYSDPETGVEYQFLCNNMRYSPFTIAGLYKKRWQIEILFKRLKQNYPLKYFLGDTENAVKIQIWTTLIVDLILKVIKQTAARKWAFSNLASMVKLHLMTYINLFAFLKAPEKSLLTMNIYHRERYLHPSLFDT